MKNFWTGIIFIQFGGVVCILSTITFQIILVNNLLDVRYQVIQVAYSIEQRWKGTILLGAMRGSGGRAFPFLLLRKQTHNQGILKY